MSLSSMLALIEFYLSFYSLYSFKSPPLSAACRRQSVFSSQFFQVASAPPRLNEDIEDLLEWIKRAGGTFNAQIQSNERGKGWYLESSTRIKANEIVLFTPKSLCISSDANDSMNMKHLLGNTLSIMRSIGENHWRAKLSLALLSERVRPSSHFRPFIRNLPMEFMGLPIFFSSSEIGSIQDASLIEDTVTRCRSMGEFADAILRPHGTQLFSGYSADVDAFGWGFAVASTRALRDSRVVGHPILVPGLDFASHSFTPNCEVIADSDGFYLVSLRDIVPGEEISMSYGEQSNDELLLDYGFTVDNNPYDCVTLNCDADLLNMGRVVMGQCPGHAVSSPSRSSSFASKPTDEIVLGHSVQAVTETLPRWHSRDLLRFSSYVPTDAPAPSVSDDALAPIGRGGDIYGEDWLFGWQLMWLRMIGFLGPNQDTTITIGGPEIFKIDGRLWALLRILYAKSESDITVHGYDPFLLQRASSMTAAHIEAKVIKTLVGIVSVILDRMDTDLRTDLSSLTATATPSEVASRRELIKKRDKMSTNVEDTVEKVHVSLLDIFSRDEGTDKDMGITKQPAASDTLPKFLGERNKALDELSVEAMVQKKSIASDGEKDSGGVVVENVFVDDEAPALERRQFTRHELMTMALSAADENNENGLSTNVREALRYRIRKKRMLTQLILNLSEAYSAVTDFSDHTIPTLLPPRRDNRSTRTEKIRNLLDRGTPDGESIRSSGGSMLEHVGAVAADLSKKWTNRRIDF